MILVALPSATFSMASRAFSFTTWALGAASFSSFRESAILRADAKKQAQILEAQGKAEAILTVQKATADSIKLLNEASPTDPVIRLRALEAFAAAADGKATKIIIPSEIQGLAGLAEGIVESVKAPAAEQK